MTIATKEDLIRLRHGGYQMSPSMWRAAEALASRPIPLTMKSFVRQLFPNSTEQTARTRLTHLRHALEGSGLRVEHVSGYRLVKEEKSDGQ